MRILITGVTGFVGGHLVEALRADPSHQLHGISRSAPSASPDSNSELALVRLHSADLLERDRIEAVVRLCEPEWVIHLAGYANTGRSFQESEQAWRDNLHATKQLYDAIVASSVRPRILYVSSGLVYGDVEPPGSICDEQSPLKPTSPYATSKAATDLLSYQYTRTHGLDIVRVRPFNQIGPRQSPDYAVASFARQIAEIEAGRRAPVLETGDLSGYRDLCDIRDMVLAYLALLQHGRTGEVYNAATGRSRLMRDVVQELLTLARVPIDFREKIDPRRIGDTTFTQTSITRLRSATGWEPQWSLRDSLESILEYWRASTQQLRARA
ncbi:NAD-dependent epimerase/dehydratase family protein [Tuwongella immobilis]|uniref:NAD-dependent epimerase/dehydratase domain-containing protein n=1 Tax=Tuwongella immobilis TaxID=692036 RepID=A0A6C2YM93_9BACT